jgi:hypothetical protein
MSGLPLRSCVVTRTGWLRQPRPLRPPPEPCPQGPTWRAKRDWPGRDGAPGVWQVAHRSSAGRRTTRNNGASAGSPGGIVGMELLARSWSACPPSPVRTSSHFTLAFGSICAPQPSEEVVYLVTKESLYSGALRIPTASPALSINMLVCRTVLRSVLSSVTGRRRRAATDCHRGYQPRIDRLSMRCYTGLLPL